MDIEPSFISSATKYLPDARITFDTLHVIGHASMTVDEMRRIKQRTDKFLKGMRWTPLKDRTKLKPEAVAELAALIAKLAIHRTARASVYTEQLREILESEQINVVRAWDASALVHLRHALQDRSDEGRGRDDLLASGGHCGPDAEVAPEYETVI